ncbi:MAG: hypothetical protein ABWZ99_00970 [Ilumatobacteraceae bacterium]
MVQMVENWAELTGTVRSIVGSDKGPGHRTVLVEADTITDVEGYPNLLEAKVGDVVPIIVRHDVLDRSGMAEGCHVHGRVRKATPFDVFAHPDDFVVADHETGSWSTDESE